MPEVKKKHGGARPNAGRKKKADEEKIQRLAIGAIVKKYKSEEDFFGNMAEQAIEGSFPHMKLLAEYAYGKPTERQEVEFNAPAMPKFSWGGGNEDDSENE